MHRNGEAVGCLLLGETKRMRALCDMLCARGVATVMAATDGNLLTAAQEGLYAARRKGGTCIAAEGEWWAAALALAAQMCVERILLIAPTDLAKPANDEREKQIVRLKGFARRNLFFCVSEVLVLEDEISAQSDRRIDSLCRRMCNSSVRRISLSDQRWTNCELSPIEAAVRFLDGGEFAFSLAK